MLTVTKEISRRPEMDSCNALHITHQCGVQEHHHTSPVMVLETKAQSIVKRSDRDKEDLKLEHLKH